MQRKARAARWARTSNIKSGVTATLTNSGYEVESASDGDEAFRLYRKRGPYDLVLTDRHHPGMDGLDLAAAIRQENPMQAIAFFTADVHSEPVYAFRRKFQDIPVLLKVAVQASHLLKVVEAAIGAAKSQR